MSPRRSLKPSDFFWVTNISKKIVSLTDLGICIYPMRSVNLLDNKHYSLTKEQLIASASSGSLLAKSKLLSVRKVPPPNTPKVRIPFQEDAIYPSKQRSAVEVEDIKYEELNISDDDYANENADLAEKDHLGKYNKDK
jgi:hypothetical protein